MLSSKIGKKVFGVLACAMVLSPMLVKASTAAPDYEIMWGVSERDICGVGSLNDSMTLTSHTCVTNPTTEEVTIGTFTDSKNTFEFAKDQSFYLYGGSENMVVPTSTIVVNGKNAIDLLVDDDYIITGEGSLTVKGIYGTEKTLDEDGNQLYYVIFRDINGAQYKVLDENGDNFLVTSKEDFEAKFEEAKKYNSALEGIEYDSSLYFINPDYHVVPGAITEEWVNSHIKTDKMVTYGEDGSVVFSDNKVLTDEEVVFESETNLNTNYKLESKNILADASDELTSEIEALNKDLLAFYDISILDENNDIVPMEDGKFTIRIKLTDEMKKYTTLTAAYIKDNKVVETFAVQVEGDYAVFNTTHLSEYAILGSMEDTDEGTGDPTVPTDPEESEPNPSTSDPVMLAVTLSGIGLLGLGITLRTMKKRLSN